MIDLSRKHWSAWTVAFAIALAAFAAFATLLVLFAKPNADEGFYAYSAYATTQGMMPYRDFGYTQAPLLPYIHGLLMRVTGFGVLELRWLNAAWSAGTLAVMAWALRRADVSMWVGAVTLAAWISSVAAMYFSVVGKTYAFAQFALVCGSLAYLPWGRSWTRFVWLAFWGTAAVATRLTVAPAVVVLWVGLVAQHGRKTPLVAAVLTPVLAGAAAFGPFIAAAPENFVFWTLDFHLYYAGARRPLVALGESMLLSPAIAGLTLAALVGVIVLRRYSSFTWVFAAGIIGWGTSAMMSGVYGEYAAPLWPLTLVGAGIHLQSLADNRLARWVTWAALPVLAAAGISNPSGRYYRPWIAPGYIEAIDGAADALERHTSADDLVFASMPEIPLRAGRRIPPELVLGKFSITIDFNETDARALHLMTHEHLMEQVEHRRPAALVLTPHRAWSFGQSFPTLNPLPSSAFDRFLAAAASNYSLVHRDDYFYVFVRKEEETAAPSETPR